MFDDYTVQQLPPAVTYQSTTPFTSEAGVFGGAVLGNWSVGGGVYTGSPAAGQTRGISLAQIGVASLNTESWLELSAKVTTSTNAGFVFDRYSDTDFKFVAVDVVAKTVVIGHYTKAAGFVIDASTTRSSLAAGQTNTLLVSLKGSTVSVSVNGGFSVSATFNAPVVDGRFGLLARGGAGSFDDFVVKTNDQAFTPPAPAQVASGVAANESAASGSRLDAAELATAARAVLQRMDVDEKTRATLGTITVRVADLPGAQLGEIRDGILYVDNDAAGHGWFIDSTPGDDREFSGGVALARSPAAGGIDLLSVLAHEYGHAAGLEHEASGVMPAELLPGIRTLAPAVRPGAHAAQDAFGASLAAPVSRWESNSAPVIHWNDAMLGSVTARAIHAPTPANWASDFVNHLGRKEEQRSPNANLRLALPVASRTAAALSNLSPR